MPGSWTCPAHAVGPRCASGCCPFSGGVTHRKSCLPNATTVLPRFSCMPLCCFPSGVAKATFQRGLCLAATNPSRSLCGQVTKGGWIPEAAHACLVPWVLLLYHDNHKSAHSALQSLIRCPSRLGSLWGGGEGQLVRAWMGEAPTRPCPTAGLWNDNRNKW